jgi:hypothetical protein
VEPIVRADETAAVEAQENVDEGRTLADEGVVHQQAFRKAAAWAVKSSW